MQVLFVICLLLFGTVLAENDPVIKNESSYEYNSTVLLKTVELNGVRYYFSEIQTMSWMDAMFYCQAFGFDLASIDNQAENDAIADYLDQISLGSSNVYLSGNKIGRSSYWLWLSGRPMIYENWASGEPGGTLGYNCMSMLSRVWYARDCKSGNNFVCEETPSAITTPEPTTARTTLPPITIINKYQYSP